MSQPIAGEKEKTSSSVLPRRVASLPSPKSAAIVESDTPDIESEVILNALPWHPSMNRTQPRSVHFADLAEQLTANQVWQYERSPAGPAGKTAQRTVEALKQPLDFPPVADALVPGDRVALAVDPNLPELVDIVTATAMNLRESGAEAVDVVLWDEAKEETLSQLREQLQREGTSLSGRCEVLRHDSADRESLRYLAADDDGEPLYLNRAVVDADFVLPVVAERPLDALSPCDPAGVFPALADSASRCRYRDALRGAGNETVQPEIAWLLGVHVLMSVTADACGRAGRIVAGTPQAVRQQVGPAPRRPDEFPPDAALIVASLDGDTQQQTWANAARAVAAASRYAEPGGTIVLWTEIDQPLGDASVRLGDSSASMSDSEEKLGSDGFPLWESHVGVARTFERVAAEHRILLHSRLDAETVEAMELGVVRSPEELRRVSSSFASCGILRAAQFAGSTDTPASRISEDE